MQIVFGSHPFEPRKPDPGFEQEFNAAMAAGCSVNIVSMEGLLEERNANRAVRWITPKEGPTAAVYRGWMLSETDYTSLGAALRQVNLDLINDPNQYATCHYLPNSYSLIEAHTAHSNWFEVKVVPNDEQILNALRVFGDRAVVVKDYVKSQKHYWSTACFIPKASDSARALCVVREFLKSQGSSLNRGLVFREFLELETAGKHGKSGMPLSREVRLFFLNGKRLLCADYWNAGVALPTEDELHIFDELAQTIPSNFFSMDIAKLKAGPWIVMELGDGQVAGLPEGLDPVEFYRALKNAA